MKILVLGGTYFLGRTFVEMAAGTHQLTLLNRGNNPLSLPGVTEYHMDRHDGESLGKLNGMEFDCVVDFCAYEKGDITNLLEKSGISTGQYLFVSTCDVYRREPEILIKEDAPLEDRQFPGPEGAYIAGKAALEQESDSVFRLPPCVLHLFTDRAIMRPENPFISDGFNRQDRFYIPQMRRGASRWST